MQQNSDRYVNVYQMLAARDKRVFGQLQMVAEFVCPVVSFTLNIPGPVKTSDRYLRIFDRGKDAIVETIRGEEWAINKLLCEYEVTGYECRMSVNCDPVVLKRKLAELEEKTPVGRLYDIDVIRTDGSKVSREEIGKGMRQCIICQNPAHVCGRNRSHTIREMTDRIDQIIREEEKNRECQ